MRAILAIAMTLSAVAPAQIQTLSQSTNNTTIAANASIACTVGNPPQYTVDNGYFRSYPLAALPSNINIVSIQFGVQSLTSTAATRPMIIRLFSDPNGGAPSPYTSLVLRHTENFTLAPITVPTFFTQALTGPAVTFLPSETLVVEVNSPSVPTTGNVFFIGSNSLGQSAPGYLRAPACVIPEPTNLSTLAFPNMHMIIDVNYVPSSLSVNYPGTNEDVSLSSAVNAAPLTTGIGNDIKTTVAGDHITFWIVSPLGGFNFTTLVFAAQPFFTGFPPSPAAPHVWISSPGAIFLISPDVIAGPVLLPPLGTTLAFMIPPGFTGASCLFQAGVLTATAANGLFASTDAHEIQIL